MNEQAFLAALAANPDDDLTRLVYADWLDDQGLVLAAEYLRAECKLATLAPEEQGALDVRLSELLPLLAPEWMALAGKRYDVILQDYTRRFIIHMIKTVRRAAGIGAAEAKCLVESVPQPVRERIDRSQAEALKKGCQVALPKWPEFHATIILRLSAPVKCPSPEERQ